MLKVVAFTVFLVAISANAQPSATVEHQLDRAGSEEPPQQPLENQKPAEQTKQKATVPQDAGSAKERTNVNSCDCGNCCSCCNQAEKGWWEKLKRDPNALFAGLVAVFTLGLLVVGARQVRVSERQVVVSKQQADLTETLELPIPVVERLKLVAYADENGPVILPDPVPPGPVPDFCRVLIALHNVGRSPMRITQFCIEWKVAPTLDPQPVYTHFEDWSSLIPANQGSWAMATRIGDIRLSSTEHQRIAERQAYLWVYGFFRYTYFGNKSTDVGFLARWDIVQGFVREPNNNYEYQRESRSNA